ncbi:MAG: energy-coupling factor transporter transmembrane protein EcfT [Nesterenkonia sp.]|nr:energy-coupling factor transporter transmembrane protein EcfT [Nesterenkonia sp.]
MISLYVPGTSVVHRAPPASKVGLLAVVALALSVAPASVWTIIAALAAPAAVVALARLRPSTVLADVRQLLVLFLAVTLVQLIFLDPLTAATNTARIVSIVLLAQCVTRTTPIAAMVETAERFLGPLRRFGVRPERVGLAMGLVLTAIGQLSVFVAQVRDAQRSRGVRLPPWSWVVPVLVLALHYADDVGDALEARGQG